MLAKLRAGSGRPSRSWLVATAWCTVLPTSIGCAVIEEASPRTPTVCETAAGFMITVMSRITLTATGMLAFASAKPPAVTCTS